MEYTFAKIPKKRMLLVPVLFLLFACNNKAPEGVIQIDKDISYAVGMYVAEQFRAPVRIQYDYKAFMDGFRDFTDQQESRITRDEMYAKMEVFIALITGSAGNSSREEADAFLLSNAQRPEVIVTASGLQYEIISEGSGPKPGPQNMVEVHYEGMLLDGTIFDSSISRGEPALFNLDLLIPGWTEGIQLMNTGSVYRFYIDPDLGYGPQGMGGVIPPNAVLIFYVELLGVQE